MGFRLHMTSPPSTVTYRTCGNPCLPASRPVLGPGAWWYLDEAIGLAGYQQYSDDEEQGHAVQHPEIHLQGVQVACMGGEAQRIGEYDQDDEMGHIYGIGPLAEVLDMP